MNRRQFIRDSALAGGATVSLHPFAAAWRRDGARDRRFRDFQTGRHPAIARSRAGPLDLVPERALPAEHVRPVSAGADAGRAPRRATGWICADSRYLLQVNGERRPMGPAPADPRWMEADPLDLTPLLRRGGNAIGATVLFYGQGDGTWPCGKPGFLFWLEIGARRRPDGEDRVRCVLAGPSMPGLAGRTLRSAGTCALSRKNSTPANIPAAGAAPAIGPGRTGSRRCRWPDRPTSSSACTDYPEYQLEIAADPKLTELRSRSIPVDARNRRAREEAGRDFSSGVDAACRGIFRVPHAGRLPGRIGRSRFRKRGRGLDLWS